MGDKEKIYEANENLAPDQEEVEAQKALQESEEAEEVDVVQQGENMETENVQTLGKDTDVEETEESMGPIGDFNFPEIKFKNFDEELDEDAIKFESLEKEGAVDLGEKLLSGYTVGALKGIMGVDNVFLRDKEYYWKQVKGVFEDKYGDKAEDQFNTLYANMEGEYTKYLQDEFEIQYLYNAAPTISARGELNPLQKMAQHPIFRRVNATVTGEEKFSDLYFNRDRSTREAYTTQARIPDGMDENGMPRFKIVDLTPDKARELLEVDGVSGFAYNKAQQKKGGHAVLDKDEIFVDVVFDGKVWDDEKQEMVWVRDDQIVERFNYMHEKGSLMDQFFRNDGETAKGLSTNVGNIIKSLYKTGIGLVDLLNETQRAGIGLFYSDEKDIDLGYYTKLKSTHVWLKSLEPSMSDEGMKGGVIGSTEGFVSITSDVLAQLLYARGLAKGAEYASLNLAKATPETAAKISSWVAMGSLTGIAAKDFYQSSLDHGFNPRQAAFSMGLAGVFMWQANKLTNHVFGPDEMAARYYSNRFVVDDLFKNRAKGLLNGAIKETQEGLMRSVKNTMMRVFMKPFKHGGINSMYMEALEEMGEELGSEATKQLMNGYVSLTGKDLKSMKVGEGRYRSYWDKGYWKDFGNQLLQSGIAGGIGGLASAKLFGHFKTSQITEESEITDYILAGKGNILKEAVNDAVKKYKFADKELSYKINEDTGAFALAASDSESLNKAIGNLLLQDISIVEETVRSMGIDRALKVFEEDTELKANLDKVSVLSDLRDITLTSRELLEKTGIDVSILNKLEDKEIEKFLLLNGNKSALKREEIRKARLEFIEKLEKAPDADKEKLAEVKKSFEKAEGKEDEDILKALDNDPEAITELLDNVRKIRGIRNGSSASTYFQQYAYYEDNVFGSIFSRNPEFKEYGVNFFKDVLENSKETMRRNFLKKLNLVEAMDSLSEVAKQVTTENVEEFSALLDENSALNSEAIEHLEKVAQDLLTKNAQQKKDDLSSYLTSKEFIEDLRTQFKKSVEAIDLTKVERADENETDEEYLERVGKLEGKKQAIIAYLESDASTSFLTSIVTNAFVPYAGGNAIPVINTEGIQLLNKFSVNSDGKVGLRISPQSDSLDPSNIHLAKDYLGEEIGNKLIATQEDFRGMPNPRVLLNKLAVLKDTGRIDVKTPKMYDPMDASWADSDMNLETMENLGGSVAKKIQELVQNDLKTYNDNTKFSMDEKSLNELKRLKKVARVRAAQRDLLRSLVFKKKTEQVADEETGEIVENVSYEYNAMGLGRAAEFNKIISKIVGDEKYPSSPRSSDDVGHIYKDLTVVADFINDFFYDPELLLQILQKEEAERTVEDKQLLKDLEGFVSTSLVPREAIYGEKIEEAPVVVDDDDEKKGEEGEERYKVYNIVKGIDNFTDLAKAVYLTYNKKFYTQYSLEQAIELVDGVEKLLDEHNIGDPSNVESSNFLDQRDNLVKNILASISHPSNNVPHVIMDLYKDAGKEVPDSVVNLAVFLDEHYDIDKSNKNAFNRLSSVDGSIVDVNTKEGKVKMEALMWDFLMGFNTYRNDLGFKKDSDGNDTTTYKVDDIFHWGVSKSKTIEHTILEQLTNKDFNLSEWLKEYKKVTDEILADKNGKYPIANQEINLMFISAFISSGANPDQVITFIQGVGGAGKTDVVISTALKIVRALNEKAGFKNNLVIHAAQFKNQRNILGNSLKEAGIELYDLDKNDGGYDYTQLIKEFEDFLNSDSKESHRLNEAMTIVFDEITNVSTLKGDKENLQKAIELLKKINVERERLGYAPIKMITLGDDSQIGYSNGDQSTNMLAFMDSYSQPKAMQMFYSMRVGNPYLRNLTKLDFIKRNSRHIVKFAKQPQYGNRYMGGNFKRGISINELMNDEKLVESIKEQMKADPTFTVGIAVDDISKLDNNSLLMQLYNDKGDKGINTIIPESGEYRIKLIETSKIQGSEFNYVVAELTHEFVGAIDGGTVSDRNKADKAINTLVTRAKDYIVVANNSEFKIETIEEEEGKLIIPTAEDFEFNKKILHEFFDSVYKQLNHEYTELGNGGKPKPKPKPQPTPTPRPEPEPSPKPQPSPDEGNTEEEEVNEDDKKPTEEEEKKPDEEGDTKKPDSEIVDRDVIRRILRDALDTAEFRTNFLDVNSYNNVVNYIVNQISDNVKNLEDAKRYLDSIHHMFEKYFDEKYDLEKHIPADILNSKLFGRVHPRITTIMNDSTKLVGDSMIASVENTISEKYSDRKILDVNKFTEEVNERMEKHGIMTPFIKNYRVKAFKEEFETYIKEAADRHNNDIDARRRQDDEEKNKDAEDEYTYGKNGGTTDVNNPVFILKSPKEELQALRKLLKSKGYTRNYKGLLHYLRDVANDPSPEARFEEARLAQVLELLREYHKNGGANTLSFFSDEKSQTEVNKISFNPTRINKVSPFSNSSINSRLLYNINQNQAGDDGLLQIYAVDTEERKETATNIISKELGVNKNIVFDKGETMKLLKGNKADMDALDIRLIGGNTAEMLGDYDNENMYVVAIDPNGNIFVLGRFFLGYSNVDGIVGDADAIEVYNSSVDWANPDEKLTVNDTAETIVDKLFPTTAKLRKVVNVNDGFNIGVSTEQFFDTFGMEAGTPLRAPRGSVKFSELEENIIKNGGIISPILINTSKRSIRGVFNGSPFILYTFNKELNLESPAVIDGILDELEQNGGIYPRRGKGDSSAKIYTDIGIIPLQSDNVSGQDMYAAYEDVLEGAIIDSISSTKSYDGVMSVDAVKIFSKKGEDVRMMRGFASIVLELFRDSKDNINHIVPYMIGKSMDTSSENVDWGDLNMDAIISEIETSIETMPESLLYNSDGTSTEDNIGVEPSSVNWLIKELMQDAKAYNDKASKTKSKITFDSEADLISSVIMPLLRSLSPTVGKAFNKGNYSPNYYSPYSVNKGGDIYIMNPHTLHGAILKEVYHRLYRNNSEANKDAIFKEANKLVRDVILPKIYDVLATSSEGLMTFDGPNNTKIVKFRTSVIADYDREAGTTNNFRYAAISEVNFRYIVGDVKSINVPNLNIVSSGLFGILEAGGVDLNVEEEEVLDLGTKADIKFVNDVKNTYLSPIDVSTFAGTMESDYDRLLEISRKGNAASNSALEVIDNIRKEAMNYINTNASNDFKEFNEIFGDIKIESDEDATKVEDRLTRVEAEIKSISEKLASIGIENYIDNFSTVIAEVKDKIKTIRDGSKEFRDTIKNINGIDSESKAKIIIPLIYNSVIKAKSDNRLTDDEFNNILEKLKEKAKEFNIKFELKKPKIEVETVGTTTEETTKKVSADKFINFVDHYIDEADANVGVKNFLNGLAPEQKNEFLTAFYNRDVGGMMPYFGMMGEVKYGGETVKMSVLLTKAILKAKLNNNLDKYCN